MQKNSDLPSSFCPHIAECGGCAAFDESIETYRRFKRKAVADALRELPAIPDMRDTVFIDAGTRRRVTFAVTWNGVARWFGLNALKSHTVVGIADCPQLCLMLRRLIIPARAFFTDKKLPFLKKEGTGDVSFLATPAGADMVVTLPFAPDLNWRVAMADFAEKNGVARISWRQKAFDDAEPLVTLTKPFVNIADKQVFLPAGAFLQPSEQGQTVLTDTVVSFVGNKPKNVVDLFCGLGTFTLPLMRKKRRIKAVDNASASLKALAEAGDGRIDIEDRDLFRMPLWTDDFSGVDAVVFDPPRAGAEAQCKQLALSDVPVIVAVSCAPQTFARDAGILIGGGYELQSVQPVDQFVFSKHSELVARFVKR